MSFQVNNLTYQVSQKFKLNIESFSSEKGNFIGIIGPNGSGKSTLIKLLTKQKDQYQGLIYFQNQNLKDIKLKDFAKEVSIVAQHNHLEFSLSVEQIISMAFYKQKRFLENINQKDHQKIEEVLTLVNLENYLDQDFNQLSGGQQQRVILARALAQDTPYIILDEPTNYLDIYYQLEIMEILKKTNKKIICVIHDLNIALAYCDYLYVIKEGSMIASGKPEQIINEELVNDLFHVQSQTINPYKMNRKQLLFYLQEETK